MIDIVADGTLVRVHYTVTIQGKVVESSREREPMEFQAGKNQVIAGFEKALKGMQIGEKKTFQVTPDEAYGQDDASNIREISKDKLPSDITPEEGMLLSARKSDGQTIPAIIMEVKKDVVVLDFNHPLAGQTLDFEVEIIDIKANPSLN